MLRKIKHRCIYCKQNIFYTVYNGRNRTCSSSCAKKWEDTHRIHIRLKRINTNQLRKYFITSSI